MVDFDKAVALLESQAKLDVFAKAFKGNHVLKHAYDRKGNTLLHLATAQGCLEIVKFLLEQHASVSASNQEGQTALHLAALTTDSRLSAALLVEIESMPSKARAAVLDAKDAELGRTALHYAAKLGSEHTVQQLIQAGADANVLTKTKHTALRSAAAQGHTTAVTVLIAGKAKVNIQDVKGVNPACSSQHRQHGSCSCPSDWTGQQSSCNGMRCKRLLSATLCHLFRYIGSALCAMIT